MNEINLSDGEYVLPKITRVDVISGVGRIQYSNVETSLFIQDEGRTLKVFIDKKDNAKVDKNDLERIFDDILQNIKDFKK